MLNVLWLVGMLFASTWGQSAPAPEAEQGLLGGGAVCEGLGAIAGRGSPIGLLLPLDRVPDRAEVLRALPSLGGVTRDNFDITCEKLIDKTNPPRFYPLVGPAKLRQLHWKCTVAFNEKKTVFLPIPKTLETRRTQVVYIDKDYLIPCPSEKANAAKDECSVCPAKAAPRILTCWDAHVHTCPDAVQPRTQLSMLKGSVYLYSGNQTVCAKGAIFVEARDRTGCLLAAWRFDSASLDKLKRTDLLGVGYTLALPLDQQCLDAKDVQLKLTYRAADGHSCSDDPTRLTLRCNAPAVVQAVYTETSNRKTQISNKQMTFTDIVTLSKRGISDDIIIRQMHLTESVYDLTIEQILSLHENGVSDHVIRAMQDRRPVSAPAIQAVPRPYDGGQPQTP